MSRSRPNHGIDTGRSRVRARQRRRSVARGGIRLLFWGLVLIGTFILGIGYGKTLSGDDELRRDKVTVDVDRGRIEATLPTRTVTVTKTVAKPVRKPKKVATSR